ncbi:MAG: hypothetical protein D8H97_23775 [Neisseria sp.]|nr:MAG: hypothetical protein D8H97_23775 [Neisseria sp.]
MPVWRPSEKFIQCFRRPVTVTIWVHCLIKNRLVVAVLMVFGKMHVSEIIHTSRRIRAACIFIYCFTGGSVRYNRLEIIY